MELKAISLCVTIVVIGSFMRPIRADDTYHNCLSGCTTGFFDCTSYLQCALRPPKCVKYCYYEQDLCEEVCEQKSENDVLYKRNPSLTTGLAATSDQDTPNDVINKRIPTFYGFLKKAMNKGGNIRRK